MDIALMSTAGTVTSFNVNHEDGMDGTGDVEPQGETIQKLMSTSAIVAIKQAAQPHLGGSFDLKV
ncbi:putative motility protein [Peribacillus sp. NPDC096379]|uniref:putative motility protein n=1 Tax=Peribacillus sp. NPDC096379 TaxID=3364393 RepID=UPI0038149AB3